MWVRDHNTARAWWSQYEGARITAVSWPTTHVHRRRVPLRRTAGSQGRWEVWCAETIPARADDAYVYVGTHPLEREAAEATPPPPSTGDWQAVEQDPVDVGKVEIEHDQDNEALTISAKGQHLVRNLDDLVRVAEIDLTDWRVHDHSVNTWTTPMKGDRGRPLIVRNWQVKARLERRHGVECVAPVQADPLPRLHVDRPHSAECVLVVPDTQHGYRWSRKRDRLIPLHDRPTIDAIIQLAERLQPDTIVHIGDALDLAPWSTRYPRPPDLRDTTQPALLELHHDLRRLRAACPAARMIMLEGNHEDRINRALVSQLSEAIDLRAVGDDDSVLSVARLLNLDAVDCEYIGPYGADVYLGDVRYSHGERVRARGGATVAAVVGESDYSQVFGHIHRVEVAHRTVHGPRGARTIGAMAVGCACRTDGAVPGVSAQPDWQHGCGIVWTDDRGHEYLQPVTINRGRLTYDGTVIVGIDRGAEYAEAIGWPVG